MSEVIDSRIVEMRFDNSQFESNVRESMKTIDDLKSSLNFEDSVKGLDKFKVDFDASGAVQGLNAISEAASDCDLSGISDSAESVKLSFSALEVVAVTALGKMASAAIDAGANLVNAFAIQPITDGFAEYNQQLQSTRVITSNTGQSLAEVTAILDELNTYADKTIYSFGDMTQAMGYFTSALGEKSAEASAIIAKGISNWAASTGQGNQVAKRVMYQVSQGLSTGMFRLMDWKSIENTGAMAGKRYQEAFVQTASEMYGLAAEEILVDKKGNAASFRDSLQTGWLTNEVFLETMRKFANETDILNEKGERAFQWMEDAATKVLTFSDLLDTVREQLGTGWGETWKIVFGDFEQSISFFTGISEKLGSFITRINDARNAIFEGWAAKGGRNLLFGISEEDTGAIGNLLDGILNILDQVHSAFINAFGTDFLSSVLYGATEIISKLANGFKSLTELPIIYSALGSMFSILKAIFSVIGDLYKIIEPFLGLAFSVVEKILAGLSSVAEVVANVVNIISEKFSSLSDKLTAPFKAASQYISDTFGAALDLISEKISSMWNWLKQFDIFGIFGDAKQITEEIPTAISKVDSQVQKTVSSTSKGIKSVTERLAELGIAIDEDSLSVEAFQQFWWDALDDAKKQQNYAVDLWDELSAETRAYWLELAEDNGYIADQERYDTLIDIYKQWHHWGKYANEEFKGAVTELDSANKELTTINKQSKEVSGTWFDLISESDKNRYFVAEYWDDLTEEQKEGWKQYALGLGLFTEEELRQFESAEKSIGDILTDREDIIQKKRREADAWWDLIDDDKKKQYFAGQFWDDLTDEQREAWRKRAEAYELYDPEEYARILEEMSAAEQAAFSEENTENIVESAEGLDTWYSSASKVPVIGGFLEKFGWIATKTVKNAKSFASAAKTSFGGFIDFVKVLNGTDLTFFQKFKLASTYFKEHVVDYLGELVVKNFKSIGNAIANTKIGNGISSFISDIKSKFSGFKSYIKDLNDNAQLTFPEKIRSALEYFNTNILGYFGDKIKEKFKEIAGNISDNKIVSNLVSFTSAAKTKFQEFKSYITDLNANTELTFPQKLEKSLEFLKTNVIDYFLELINKNLKSVGIDIEKVGEEISQALTNAANFIDKTLQSLGINTESIRKFFWNDDGSLKSIPEVITALGDEIEKALGEVKKKLIAKYEEFFPSTEEGEFTGPLGWLINIKKKVDDFISSLFGTSDDVEKQEGKVKHGGILAAALGVLGLTGGSSIMKSIGNMNSLFTFGKNIGISGGLNFSKVAVGVALAAGAFGLLSKIDFSKLGIDFKGFTDYFKDGEGNLLSVSEVFGKVSESISNSRIGKWVSNTAQLIGKNANTAFDLFKNKAVYFSEFIKVLNESNLTFPQKFSLATRFFKEHFIKPFGELTKKNLKTIGIDIDGFLGKFKNTEGDWLSIGEIFSKAGNKISAVIEEQKAKFEKTAIGQWISEKLEKFKTTYSGVFDWFGSVGKNISESGAVKWISDTAKLIGRNASSAFTLFGEKINIFKEHLKSLNDNTEMTFPQKIKAALDFFKEDVIKPFEELAKNNLKTIGIDIDAFVNYFKNSEGDWLSISEIITKVGDSIHNAFNNLKAKFKQSAFGQWLDEKLTWLKSKFDNTSDWLQNFSKIVSRFMVPAIGGVGLVLVVRRVGQLFDFIQSIGQRFSGRTPIENANAFAIRATSLAGVIKDVAVAVVMIAGALAGLSVLNQDNLSKATNSLSKIVNAILGISVVFGVISFFTSKKEETIKGTTALLELIGSVFLIVVAFKIITTLPLNDIGKLAGSFGVLIVLMGLVAGLAVAASKIQGSKTSFLGVLGMATAVIEMIGALYLVQLMLESHKGVGWALLTLAGLIAELGVLALAAKGVDWKAGVGLILMANSIKTMVKALEYVFDSDLLSKFNENKAENIKKIIAVCVSLFALAGINRFAGGGKAGMTLLGVAASVWVLVKAIESIANIPTDNLGTAVAVVTWLSVIMGGILVAYSALYNGNSAGIKSMIASTLQLYSVVVGVILLSGAVALLSAIDQSRLKTAAIVVGGLTIVVGAIAVFMAALSRKADYGKTLGLLATATGVAIAMGALLLALDHYIPDKSNLMSIAGSVSLLTGVVGGLAILFGKLDLKFAEPFKLVGVLAGMGLIVAGMGALLTLMAKNIPSSVSESKLWGFVKTVSTLAAVVSVMTLIFGNISIDPATAGMSALAIALIGAVLEGLIALIGWILSNETIARGIDRIVSFVERIGRGFVKMFDSLATTIGKLSWWQIVGVVTVMAGAIIALGGLGPIIGFNLGVFATELAVAAVVIVGLFDLTLPLFEKFANDGIPIFEKIASGIIKIASIIIDGVVSNVETIIDCLRDFSDFASEGFDSGKVEQAVSLASQLVEIVGAFVGDDFLSMLGKFIGELLFGEANREAFKTNITCLTGVINDFKDNVATWSFEDLAKTKTATDIADQLTTVCNKFTETDLLDAFVRFIDEKYWGDTHREAFVKNIKSLGISLAVFTACINAIPNFDSTKADSALTIADKMIAVVQKFEPENVWSAIDSFIKSKFADSTSESFQTSITNLSGAMKTFCTEVDKWVVPSDYDNKVSIVDKMIELVGKMPQLTEASGLMDIGDFGASVSKFCEEFIRATYYLNAALSKSSIEDFDGKMEVVDDLIELSEKLPDAKSAMGQFFGWKTDQTLGQFGEDFKSFGESLSSFAETMNNVPKINNWEDKKTVVSDLIDLANLLPSHSSVGAELVGGSDLATNFSSFGSSIFSFATSFGQAVSKINEINIKEDTLKKFGQMKALVGMLANLAKELPKSFTMADASGNSNMITTTFTQSLSEFMDDIVGDKGLFGGNGDSIFDKVQTVYDELDDLGDFDDNGRREKLESLTGDNGILKQLSSFANGLPELTADSNTLSNFGTEIYELSQHVSDAVETLTGGDTNGAYAFDPEPLKKMGEGIQQVISVFTGISPESLGHIASIMDSIEKLKSNDGKSLGQVLGENLIGSLLEIPDGNITSAISKGTSITGLLGDLGGLGEMINGIIPDGGLNLEGLSQIFGSADSGGTVSGGIMSLIPKSLQSYITDMPTADELKAPNTALTTMFSDINSESFGFENLSSLMGQYTAGQGFDDTGFIQMLPEELREYVTSMTGGEGIDIESANTVITNLVTGVQEAGSITPDLAQNFNDTLTAFAENGITAYVDTFNSAETDSKLNEAGRVIVDKTGNGVSLALASLPNALETASKSAVQFISDILSGDESNPYDAPGKSIISKTGSGISQALGSYSHSLENAVKSVVSFIANILSGNDSDSYESTGSSIISKTASGINSALGSYSYSLTSAARSVVDVVAGALSSNYSSYVTAGQNVISGFIAGMQNTGDVYTAAYYIGQAAINGLSDGIDSNSPSKEAMKYGKYFGEGFEIGIDSYGNSVKSASENIGNEALLGIALYVGKVYDLLDSDLEFNPTITPVLDLSEIQNGVGSVDALFSRQQAYSANMEVNGAVRARSDAMRAVSNTDNSRNFGGFTFNIYTQGTDANAIARQIGVEVTKKLRSTGNMI